MSKTLDNLQIVDSSYIKNFPNSKKIYVQGSREDIRVPMREVSLSSATHSEGLENE